MCHRGRATNYPAQLDLPSLYHMGLPSIIALAAVFYYLVWRVLLRRFVVYSPVDNLPGPQRMSVLRGDLAAFSDRQSWKYWRRLAETYGPVSKIYGPLGIRIVLVHDPLAMHSILIKDAENYPKRTSPSDDLNMLLGPGLLTTEGAHHRRQRKLLNPVFSAAHLRNMTHIFYDIAHKLQVAVHGRVSKEGRAIDVNGCMARTTLEMLGQAGLGYSFDKFVDDSTDAYGEALKDFLPAMTRIPMLGFMAHRVSYIASDAQILRVVRASPFARLRYLVGISDTMIQRSEAIINEKKTALEKGDDALVHQVGEGKDLMSILLKANTAASDSERLTDEELTAQMSTFILAGMDTTSNALSRIFHLLAMHPEVQDKLRAELVQARETSGGSGFDIDYDDLVKLPYLDAVCRETLRVYAPVILSGRQAAKDTLLPISAPVRGKDGTMMGEIPIQKGTFVLMDFQASNCNKALWGEDVYEWKPERWLEPLPAVLDDARIPGVYSNLMSFSGGSRSCIGFKFSQLEMKVVLFILLPSFAFELTDEPIAWNSGPVSYPTMGEESVRPEMLLKVKAL